MTDLKPCPFCGSNNVGAYMNYVWCNDCKCYGPDADLSGPEVVAKLWNTRPTEQASRAQALEEAAKVCEGCPFFMPPEEFYRGRIVEAIKYWNDYAKALNSIRRRNDWERHCVLRAKAEAEKEKE